MFITAFNDKVREALAAADGVVWRSTLHKQVVSQKPICLLEMDYETSYLRPGRIHDY